LESELESKFGKKLINTGSCGLHTLHNSFRHAVESCKWDVSHFLFCLHILFDDTPARRQDFQETTGSQQFPLPFCKHRWLENIKVCERAISLVEDLNKYICSAGQESA
jgi:hypothetical protein